MATTSRRSNVNKLHDLQKSYGLSSKDLKDAVRQVARPREVELPTFHEKLTKHEKIRRRVERESNKRRRYQLARWYLEEYLKPAQANRVYWEHPDFKDLVNYAYERAIGLVQMNTMYVEHDIDPNDCFPGRPETELDIPDIQWKEFCEYAKQHPIDDASQIFERRNSFKKHMRKRRKKLYSKRRMRMYDPLFVATRLDEKEMLKNLKRISYENEQRCKRFDAMMSELFEDKSVGSAVMEKFHEQTKLLMKLHEKRIDAFMKQMKHRPAPVAFEIIDGDK